MPDKPEAISGLPEGINNKPEAITGLPERTADLPEATPDHLEMIADLPETASGLPVIALSNFEKIKRRTEKLKNLTGRFTKRLVWFIPPLNLIVNNFLVELSMVHGVHFMRLRFKLRKII